MGAASLQKSLIGSKLDHFTLVAELGRGGMGVVYMADDQKLGRTVALKVLREEVTNDPDRRARFLREARSAAAASHANIAAIYEVGESEGRVYLAMELVEGAALRSLLGGGPMPLESTLKIARGVAAALAKAHDKGVVHRDLKPENVLVTHEGEAKVVDFGLAKLVGDPHVVSGDAETEVQLSQEGARIGTPAYMSPEQARGLPVDHRTDLFSFGIVLYEMVTGERPFRGATELDVTIALTRDEPPKPRDKNPDVPEYLERAILRCLAKEPSARYASAHELLRDLDSQRASGIQIVKSDKASSGADRRSELILLERVREFWIDGVLRQSVRGEQLLDLTKDERLAAVDRGFELAAPRLDEDEEPIDPGVTIADYFDRRGASLLILGEPGAGKTVTLLELASALVTRADNDASAPMPVVLSLATFRDPKQPIGAWILDQLREAYRIPDRVGRVWVEGERLALLLDGLDEMAPALVPSCVTALNRFREEHGLVPIAVACRRMDYEALPERLKLGAAIQLRELSEEQVQRFVAAGGDRLALLAETLAGDVELAALARSPLMLNIMSLSYGKESESDDARRSSTPDAAGSDRRTLLFDRYVDRMLKRRQGRTPLPRAAMMRSLIWLSRDMQRRNETVLLLEQLQPTSLPLGRVRFAYFAISRLIVAGFFGSLLQFNHAELHYRAAMICALWAPLVVLDYRLSRRPPRTTRRWFAKLGDFVLLLVVLVAALCLVFAVQFGVQAKDSFSASVAIASLMIAVFLSFVFAVPLAWRRNRLAAGSDVRTVETLRLRYRTFAFWALVLALGPFLALWLPFRTLESPSPTVWRVDTMTPERKVRSTPWSATLTADGRRIAVTEGIDRRCELIDVETGVERSTPAHGKLFVAPKGAFVASYDDTATEFDVRILDAETLEERRRLAPPSQRAIRGDTTSVELSNSGASVHAAPVSSIEFSRAADRVVSSSDLMSTLHDPTTGALIATFDGPATLASDGLHVIVETKEAFVIHRLDDGARLFDLPRQATKQASTRERAIDIDPSGKWAAISDSAACLWRVDLSTPTSRRLLPVPGCSKAPIASGLEQKPVGFAFAENGNLLVVATKTALAFLDGQGKLEHEIPTGERAKFDVSADGSRVLSYESERLRIYRGEDASMLGEARFKRLAYWDFPNIELSQDKTRILTWSQAPGSFVAALVLGVMGALIALALSVEAGVVRMKTRVNEGIHRTLRRAVMLGVGLAVIVTTADYIGTTLYESRVSSSEERSSVFLGAFVGILFALGFGGFDLANHYLLRLILALRRELPLRAAAFLDGGVQLIFLRRVGGGYIFIHRLVLEYFARDAEARWLDEQPKPPSSQSARG